MRKLLLPAIVLLLPPALLVAVWAWTDDSVDSIAAREAPVVQQPTQREVTGRQAVNLALQWDEGRTLVSPPWNGTVTSVAIAPGDVLAPGGAIATIDGVTRIAFNSPVPFHRALGSADTGADVASLHAMLLALGYLAELPPDPEFLSFATSQAIRAWELDLGFETTTGVFQPAWVAWLPAEQVVLGSVELTVAAAAPPQGSPFAQEAARIRTLQLNAAQPGQPLQFEAGVPYVLSVGGLEVPLDETNSIAPADYATLAAAVEELEPNASGFVQRETVLNALAVPSTAVVSNAGGALCLWVADEAAPTGFTARSVSLGDSRSGVTNVLEGVGVDDEVLVNPSRVLESPACP